MHRPTSLDQEQIERLRDDILDSIDEELEMEVDDGSDVSATQRRTYFRELLRLQGELVKLQDWVVASKQRVVILFEVVMPQAKAVSSNALPNDSIHAYAAFPRCLHPTTANAHSGTFNATWHTCPRLAKLCCLTEAGTTARVLNA